MTIVILCEQKGWRCHAISTCCYLLSLYACLTPLSSNQSDQWSLLYALLQVHY